MATRKVTLGRQGPHGLVDGKVRPLEILRWGEAFTLGYKVHGQAYRDKTYSPSLDFYEAQYLLRVAYYAGVVVNPLSKDLQCFKPSNVFSRLQA